MKEFCSEDCYQIYEINLENLRTQWKGKSAREFLSVVYPNREERKNVKLVDLINFNLIGDLDVSDFGRINFTSFDFPEKGTPVIITGNPRLGKIVDKKGHNTIFQDAQEWLDKWYPKNGTCLLKDETKDYGRSIFIDNFGKRRNQITELDISRNISNPKLTGELDLLQYKKLLSAFH